MVTYTPTPAPTAAVVDYLQRYVTALNNRDTTTVAALLNNPGQTQDAAERVAAYGGRGLTISSLELLPEEFPDVVRVNLTLTDSAGAQIPTYEVLGPVGGSIVMGPMRGPTPLPTGPVAPSLMGN